MIVFDANRPNLSKTKLYKELILSTSANDEWEVALVDIQYPQNWPNILETTQLAFIVEIDSEARDNNLLFARRPSVPMTHFDGAL